MKHCRLKVFSLFLTSIFAAGCASGGATTKQPAIPPAKLVSPAVMDFASSARQRMIQMDVTYELMIRPDGSPDLATLQILGKGASEMKDSITDWIRASKFEPATKDGVPVTSRYKGRIKSSSRIM